MRSFGALLQILIVSTALVASERPPAESTADPADSQRIATWVAQLSAGQYYVRDAATRNLISAGRAAVKAVLEAVDDSDLEVTTRGVFVLQQLGMAGDLETEQAARLALEKLAAARVTAAARRAADALETLHELKQDQALKQLQQLGAKVNLQHTEVGLTNIAMMAVEIGPSWRGTERDLQRLQWLRDVEQITFVGERVNDRWLRYIRQLDNLTVLKIKRAKMTSSGLDVLQGLRRLRYLKLLYVPIGDDAVERLKECNQLEKVLAYGTKISEVGVRQLESFGMDVDRRRGAFLGISVPRNNEGTDWFIGEVTKNSAADKAGLKPGDVIVKYDGHEVNDFPSLMSLIAKNDAGESVVVLVRRDGELHLKEVTFGYWD